MKSILAAAAIALMTSTAAVADGHSTLKTYTKDATTGDFSASSLIGMRVYSAEQDYDTFNADTVLPDDSGQNWDDIGEINDIIVNRDGSVKAVVLGVGGFIGINEKDVAIPMDGLKMVSEDDDAGDFFVVVKTNKAALEAAPEYVRPAEAAEERAEAMEEKTEAKEAAMEEKVEAAPITTAEDRPMLVRPEVEREGYAMVERDQLTTEDLTGARVYGAADEDVGEINSLLVNNDGKIEAAVLGIGGFIGIGEHDIRVTMDELNIMRNDEGDVRVYVDATKANLEAQPAYEG